MRGRRIAVGVLVVGLTIAAGPAARPAPTAAPAGPAAGGVSFELHLGPDGGALRHDADGLASHFRRPILARSPEDVRAFVATVAGATSRDGSPTGGATGSSSATGGTAESSGAAAGEPTPFASTIGDVTGDGLADLVTGTWGPGDGDGAQSVRRGTDGALLWDGPTPATMLVPAGDVDGDGAGDVLGLTMEPTSTTVSSTCGSSDCHETHRFEFVESTTLFDGPTGEVRWSTPPRAGHYELHISESQDADSWQRDVRESVSATFTIPSTDHDGDGGSDVVTQVLEFELTYRARSEDPLVLGVVDDSQQELTVDGSTQAELLDGAAGEPLWTGTADGGFALLEPVPHLTGDATGDLLWWVSRQRTMHRECRSVLDVPIECAVDESEPASLDLEVIDGATLRPAWSTHRSGFDLAYPTPVDDLDGDGAGDVMIHESRATADALSYEYTTTVLAGATGEQRWSEIGVDHQLPFLVGDYDGDADPDLLTVWTDLENDGIVLSRRDGRTGEELFRTTAPFAWGEGCTYVMIAISAARADLDDDGAEDLLASKLRFEDADCSGSLTTSSSSWVESTGTGLVLSERGSDDARLRFPEGDLDGDGVGDVVETVFGGAGWELAPVSATATSFAGDELWRTPLTASEQLRVTDADLDGDGGHDVLHLRPRDGVPGSEEIVVRDGATFTARWRHHAA